MAKKRLVLALGHDALGTNLPEQKAAVAKAAKTIADFIQNGWQVAITHGNTPQLGMIHTALNELAREHKEYTPAPMSVCSAMSQGYIGYDLQNALRTELIKRGIYKPVSTILTQVTVDPYDESSYTPLKVVGRTMTAEEERLKRKRAISPLRQKTATAGSWPLPDLWPSWRSMPSRPFWMQTSLSSPQVAAESLLWSRDPA